MTIGRSVTVEKPHLLIKLILYIISIFRSFTVQQLPAIIAEGLQMGDTAFIRLQSESSCSYVAISTPLRNQLQRNFFSLFLFACFVNVSAVCRKKEYCCLPFASGRKRLEHVGDTEVILQAHTLL